MKRKDREFIEEQLKDISDDYAMKAYRASWFRDTDFKCPEHHGIRFAWEHCYLPMESLWPTAACQKCQKAKDLLKDAARQREEFLKRRCDFQNKADSKSLNHHQEENNLVEKHLQQDSAEKCGGTDTPRKLGVFASMARCISENWPEWELIANVPGYSPEPDGMTPIRDIGLVKSGRLMGIRLILPDDDAVRLMKKICGAFCLAIEQEEKKHVRKKN